MSTIVPVFISDHHDVHTLQYASQQTHEIRIYI